jgi:hypothetical protein
VEEKRCKWKRKRWKVVEEVEVEEKRWQVEGGRWTVEGSSCSRW